MERANGKDYNYNQNQNTMFAVRTVTKRLVELRGYSKRLLFFSTTDKSTQTIQLVPTPQTAVPTPQASSSVIAPTTIPLSKFPDTAVQPQKKPAETVQYVLTKEALQLCSPLMRSILKGVSNQKLTISSQSFKNLQNTESISNDTTIKHDLQNFKPMLARQTFSSSDLDTFCSKKKCPLVVDIKYDGQRTFIKYQRGIGLQMTSRNGKTQVNHFRQIHSKIEEQLNSTDINSISLDGEILMINKKTLTPYPLNELQKYRVSKEIKLIQDDVQDQDKAFSIYIFDVVEKNGVDHLKTELLQRRKLIPDIPIFKPAEYKIIHFPEEKAKIEQFFIQALQKKYEGLIVKGSKDFYYTNTSRIHWAKVKRGFLKTKDSSISNVDVDLIVMGASYGTGSDNKNVFASFLCGTINDKGKITAISKVGTGMTEEKKRYFTDLILNTGLNLPPGVLPQEYDMGKVKMDVYLKPELVFQIHASQIIESSTISTIGNVGYGGLTFRFPVFKCHRADKSIKQATTAAEIIQLSKSFLFRANKILNK